MKRLLQVRKCWAEQAVNWCAITSSSISWLVHPKHPTQREKLHFIALAVAVTSPTKQQTEGTYRVMQSILSQYGNHCNQALMEQSSPPIPSCLSNTMRTSITKTLAITRWEYTTPLHKSPWLQLCRLQIGIAQIPCCTCSSFSHWACFKAASFLARSRCRSIIAFNTHQKLVFFNWC